jgi:hypothetical protein
MPIWNNAFKQRLFSFKLSRISDSTFQSKLKTLIDLFLL